MNDNIDKDRRIRDPVHGLVVFSKHRALDQLAWRLLDTPEMQRLRRIRQLGVSEFVFPSATHTRFAHSIGVFHTARQLVEIIKREIHEIGESFREDRAETAVLAALLHDVGHGPFSHVFEGVQRSRRERGGEAEKDHEDWSAEIIRNRSGTIYKLLEKHRCGLSDEIATLLEDEDPEDIYHAVVSSSFDADRLDYLRRDRLMTGTHAGAIDFEWLMQHVRVQHVSIEAPDASEDDEPARIPTFCLDQKALPAAEQFLLARHTLHEQVYFHKTTRCAEQMISKLLLRVVDLANRDNVAEETGLPANHPLVSFFRDGGYTLANYLALDDLIVWGAVESMTRASDSEVSDLSTRLRERKLYKALDIAFVGSDPGRQRQRARHIDKEFKDKLAAGKVIKDEGAKVSIYTQIGGDEDRMHKKLHILDGKKPKEISDLSPIIKALEQPRAFTRYFFDSESDRNMAKQFGGRRHMMEREDKVAAIVGAAGGKLIGRVRLQKIVYLLDQLGLKSGFNYSYHNYGPYSRELDNAAADALAFGLVEETFEHRASDGAPYSIFALRPDIEPNGEVFSHLGQDRAKRLVEHLKNENVTVLELAATIHWIAGRERVVDWHKEVTKRKSAKVRNGRLQRAVELLKRLDLAPTESSAA
jgi:uncharacterized protein